MGSRFVGTLGDASSHVLFEIDEKESFQSHVLVVNGVAANRIARSIEGAADEEIVSLAVYLDRDDIDRLSKEFAPDAGIDPYRAVIVERPKAGSSLNGRYDHYTLKVDQVAWF